MATPSERAATAREALEGYVPDPGMCDFEDALDDPGQFLLIEVEIDTGGAYITTHGSPEDAATYHDTQECPQYWSVDGLIDLDTGTRFSSNTVQHTTFEAV